MTTERPVRYAVVGFGLGGSVFHAPFIEATPGAELTAVVTTNPERVAQVRAEYPGATVVAGVARSLTRPKAA